MWQRYKIPAYPPNYPVKKEDPRESGPVSRILSPAIEENFPPIILRLHREVDPIGSAALFLDEFIEVAMGTIRDVEQYPRHTDHLLRAIALDIHRAASEMIRAFSPSTKAINLFRAIPARDDDGNVAVLVAVKRILAIPQILQPILTDIL